MSIDIKTARKTLQARFQNDLKKREAARVEALKIARDIIPKIAHRYPSIRMVYLFGSILRPGAFHPVHSDIDIAIEGGSAEEYFAFWHELEDSLPDWLVDLRDLPPDTRFKAHVQKLGEKVYG